jgi:hypothetical protein
MPEIVAEYIDRVCTVEMRMKGLPRGKTHLLYQAAREAMGRPLTLAAAEGLRDTIEPGDNVFIATGAGTPPYLPKGETDGPLGAAALARAIDLGLGGRPIYLCSAYQVDPIIAASNAAGVTVTDYAEATQRPHAGAVEVIPVEPQEGEATARSLMDKYQPVAVIAVERLGPNEKGIIHSVLGQTKGEPDANLAPMFRLAQESGAFTLGIGDGGNEIGFGRIVEAVREIQDYGAKCQCPCGSGMATVVATDVLVCASVSNWGAYGVEAMLAFLLEDLNLLHTAELERWMLQECARAGGADGAYGAQMLYVDGLTADVQAALITMLRQIVSNGLLELDRPF